MQYEGRSDVPYILQVCDPCAVFKGEKWIAGYKGDKKVKGAFLYPGQDTTQDLGERPIRFVHNIYGINAGCWTVFNLHGQGFNTVRKLISKYAPPFENLTETYIKIVAGKLKVAPDEVIKVKDQTTLRALIRIIIKVECGPKPPADLPSNWVEEKDIDYGIQMGLGIVSNKSLPTPPPKPRGIFPLTPEEERNLIVPWW